MIPSLKTDVCNVIAPLLGTAKCAALDPPDEIESANSLMIAIAESFKKHRQLEDGNIGLPHGLASTGNIASH